MLHSDLVDHLSAISDCSERLRELRYLIDTNPNVRALIGDIDLPTTRHERGGIKALQAGYTGSSQGMKQPPVNHRKGWLSWNGDRRMPKAEGRYELVNSDLTYLDNTQGGSTGVFLPDAPPPKCGELLELMACG